ncbi:coiled-coil protein [Legionella santicrucis]|uniref:Coiled-coil protein n=1 Tax=Legionella santicrucis TaxID=45074 RepID=A0A0W0YVU6_9GAMM|nr:zeta toxin family protein [Legionella santicrucis]KTD61001.1 coiled-coil protein [Legionella santicrucis]
MRAREEIERFKSAGWNSVLENSRQSYTLTDKETFNNAMDKLDEVAESIKQGLIYDSETMHKLISEIASNIEINLSMESEEVASFSAQLLIYIYDINTTEKKEDKIRKALELAKYIEHEVIHGHDLVVNDKQTELAVLLTNFALLATELNADDTLPLIKKTRELGAYKRIGLDNMRALSRTVITGTIDVSAAESRIPESLQIKLKRNGLDPKVVPPLCKDVYEKLELTGDEINILKENEKMARLDVRNLITKTKAEIVQMIETNYNQAMNLAFKVADEKSLKSPEDVKNLLGQIATIMGNGIVDGDWKRTHDSEKFKVYTRVKDLESQLNDFSREFFHKLQDLKIIKDPKKREQAAIELAAWCEYRINLTDHFLADGCGKTSALMANFVFMAAEIPPKAMPVMDRRNYFNFDVVPTTNIVTHKKEHSSMERKELAIRQKKEWECWLRHYKSSFFPQDYRAITCDNAWRVPSVTLGQHLETLGSKSKDEDKYVIPEDANFTNLHHCLRGGYEVAELASAIGSPDIQKLITYPMTRLNLFHTIVYAETELKTETDEDIVEKVRDVYRHLKGSEVYGVKFNKWLNEKQQEFANESRILAEGASKGIGEYREQYAEVLNTIKQRYKSGEYILGNHTRYITKKIPDSELKDDLVTRYGKENLIPNATNPKEIILRDPEQAIEEIAKRIIEDRAYQNMCDEFFAQEVEPLISDAVDECGFERLDIPDPEDRVTFMMAGAPACGKGSAVATVATMAEEHLDVEWDNTVKVNTDTHRLMISHPHITGERSEFSGTLNNHEAGLLTDLAYSRLQKKVKQGVGPHILIDGVNMSKERMDLGIANSGKLLLTVVTVPPEISVERAFSRGQGDGRFVPTSYNLSKHKQVSKNFFKDLQAAMGKNAEIILFDTNVPRGVTPKRIMAADLGSRSITIYDKKLFSEFLAKANIDVTATCSGELYMLPKDKVDESYHEKLEEMGFLKIRYEEEKPSIKKGAQFTIFKDSGKQKDKYPEPHLEDDQEHRRGHRGTHK